MNLPSSSSASHSASSALISTHTILLLSGVLFGMCVSGNLPTEVKTWFILAGATGLVAYLGLSVVARASQKTQQRIAVMHAEERLDRHSQMDLCVDNPRVDLKKASTSQA